MLEDPSTAKEHGELSPRGEDADAQLMFPGPPSGTPSGGSSATELAENAASAAAVATAARPLRRRRRAGPTGPPTPGSIARAVPSWRRSPHGSPSPQPRHAAAASRVPAGRARRWPFRSKQAAAYNLYYNLYKHPAGTWGTQRRTPCASPHRGREGVPTQAQCRQATARCARAGRAAVGTCGPTRARAAARSPPLTLGRSTQCPACRLLETRAQISCVAVLPWSRRVGAPTPLCTEQRRWRRGAPTAGTAARLPAARAAHSPIPPAGVSRGLAARARQLRGPRRQRSAARSAGAGRRGSATGSATGRGHHGATFRGAAAAPGTR